MTVYFLLEGSVCDVCVLVLLPISDPETFVQLLDDSILHVPSPTAASSSSPVRLSTYCSFDVCVYYWMRHIRSKWLKDQPVINNRASACNILLLISGIEPNPGVTVYLVPWAGCTPGYNLPRGKLYPGVQPTPG